VPDRVAAATEWADRYGYSRAVRAGDLIEVAGTVGRGDGAYEQARNALETIVTALRELGAGPEHVVRTRMFVVDIAANGDDVGRAHGEVFAAIRPATAMYGVAGLIAPEFLVEIEATASVHAGALD
jgi:enamine deaminase RidA (YjgF/YER057c/UK114 family)